VTIQQLDQAINKGELALAIRLGESLYRDSPGSQHVALSLSEAYRQAGKTAQASQTAKQAYHLDPAFVFAQAQYLRCLLPYADHKAMFEILQQALKLDIHDPWCLQVFSDAAVAIDEWQVASEFLGKLEQHSQGVQKAQAQYMRGVSFQVSGMNDKAILLFRAAQHSSGAVAPRALWSLTSVDPAAVTTSELDAALGDPSVSEQEKRYLWQASGQKRHSEGDHEQAFDCWQRANTLSEPLHQYSHQRWEDFFAQLQDGVICGGEFVRSAEAEQTESPVFIVGLPRSGSTLVEQLLVASGQVQALGELRDLEVSVQEVLGRDIRPLPFDISNDDWCRVAQSDLAVHYDKRTASRREKGVIPCDKNPANVLWLGIILNAWPTARIIHVHKAPEAACLGAYRQLFSAAAPWSYRLEDIAHYYHHYRALISFWEDRFPGRILDVQYEDFVSHPKEQGRKIFQYLGLDWRDDLVAGVGQQKGVIPTASSSQVRAGVHQGYLHAWEPYKAQLALFTKAIS